MFKKLGFFANKEKKPEKIEEPQPLTAEQQILAAALELVKVIEANGFDLNSTVAAGLKGLNISHYNVGSDDYKNFQVSTYGCGTIAIAKCHKDF